MTYQLTRRAILAALAASTANAAFANAPLKSIRPQARPGPRIKPTIDGVIASARLSGVKSYVVMDMQTGQVLEQLNPTQKAPPASVSKVPTAGFGLAKLGADYRFETKVLTNGSVQNGVLNGDLMLLGGGDPTLNTVRLAAMVQGLVSKGIRSVTGRFYVSAGSFPRIDNLDPSQSPEAGYNPTISGLNLNFNRIRLEWTPKGQGAYETTMRATGRGFAPDIAHTKVTLVDRQAPVYDYTLNKTSESWSIARHALGKGGARWLPTRLPELYAGRAFQQIALQLGLKLAAPQVGSLKGQLTQLQSDTSDNLRDIARGMLKHSNNLTAEIIGLSANLPEKKLGAGLNKWAPAYGLNGKFADYSGLSDKSRITAQGLCQFLHAHHGTMLPDIMPEIKLKPKDNFLHPDMTLLAKTGTLNFVSTLCGYIKVGGRTLGFAILTNDLKKRADIDPKFKDSPKGARTWSRRSRSMQFDMIRVWAETYAS